mmetsp:Transcript_21428/g.30023  ORF Transcript_21428/g.30023 Transcript_21428/m.30023 type:complete len:281 (+) Transcript_21428:639-1481(+)
MIVRNFNKFDSFRYLTLNLIKSISSTVKKGSSTIYYVSKINNIPSSLYILIMIILDLKFFEKYLPTTIGLIHFMSFSSLIHQLKSSRNHVLLSSLVRCLFIFDFDLLSLSKQFILLKNFKMISSNEVVFLMSEFVTTKYEYFHDVFQMKFYYTALHSSKSNFFHCSALGSISDFNRTIITDLTKSFSSSDKFSKFNRNLKKKTTELLNKQFYFYLNLVYLKKKYFKISLWNKSIFLKELLLRRYKFFLKSNISILQLDYSLLKLSFLEKNSGKTFFMHKA